MPIARILTSLHCQQYVISSSRAPVLLAGPTVADTNSRILYSSGEMTTMITSNCYTDDNESISKPATAVCLYPMPSVRPSCDSVRGALLLSTSPPEMDHWTTDALDAWLMVTCPAVTTSDLC